MGAVLKGTIPATPKAAAAAAAAASHTSLPDLSRFVYDINPSINLSLPPANGSKGVGERGGGIFCCREMNVSVSSTRVVTSVVATSLREGSSSASKLSPWHGAVRCHTAAPRTRADHKRLITGHILLSLPHPMHAITHRRSKHPKPLPHRFETGESGRGVTRDTYHRKRTASAQQNEGKSRLVPRDVLRQLCVAEDVAKLV